MAEPLSVLSGIVTLIGASTTIIKDLRSLRRNFREAEDDFLALLNEINDFNAVLLEARKAYMLSRGGQPPGSSATPGHGLDSLTDEIKEAQSVLHELGVYVKSIAKHAHNSNGIKVNKITWLKELRNLRKRRAELRDCRSRIHFMLDVSAA